MIRDGILGLAVADALGVPVEFYTRVQLKENPVTDFREYGTHNQPAGTWSDDTSLTLCLLDSLTTGRLDYKDIMNKFLGWMREGHYTPYHQMFDIGNATRQALFRFELGETPLRCGGRSPQDNGNGSLMRILPAVYYCIAHYGRKVSCEQMLPIIHNVSSLTHAHVRSQIACGIYAIIVRNLIQKQSVQSAVEAGIMEAFSYYGCQSEFKEEIHYYRRIAENDFGKLPEEEIKSSGYVVDTLEAALWCLLGTNSYKECVLKAVNLGKDTDTVSSIAGGLAGIAYGQKQIPEEWLNQLARRDYIIDMCERCEKAMKI